MTTRQMIKKLFEPAKQHKWAFAILLLRGIFLALVSPIFALMVKDIITSVERGNIDDFVFAVAIIALLMFIAIITSYTARKNLTNFRTGLQSTLYQHYLWIYLWLENTFTERLWTGQINNILQRWCDNWMSLVGQFPLEWFSYILRAFLVFLIMAYYLWWQGFLIVFVLFIVSFSIAQWWNRQSWPLKKKLRDCYTSADKDIVKVIMSKWEINQSQRWSYALEKIQNIFKELIDYEQSVNRLRIFSLDIQKWAIQAMQIGFLLFIWYGVVNGTYEIGLIAMFWMLSNQVNSSIEEINNYITNFHTQIIYIQKLRDTFDTAPRMQWFDEGKNFILTKGDISLDTISFSYGGSPVFSNFSLNFKGWTKTALVGESGGGKTTLIKLISAYVRPDSGQVVIDGQDLSSIKLSDYYRHIGYLTQDPSVFDGTIYENLVYALEDDNSEDIEKRVHEVIKLAKCEFIYDLPQDLHTEIGERGIRLSWGQKQRLAIAKIMLKNPEIILLDEPTSALDSFNEELVSQALHNLFQWKTVIIVAHRLQTVKNSDRILYIQGWKVIEEWTHDELIAQWANYKKMLDLQSGF